MQSNISDWPDFLWSDVDWKALRTLRGRFLQFDPREAKSPEPVEPAEPGAIVEPTPAKEPDRSDYWSSVNDLKSYDFTFGERIGWKWDTVLAELKTRGWTPPTGTVLDWGCGTGVAGRRVTNEWPDAVRKLTPWDRSARARDFAVDRARAAFPHTDVRAAVAERPACDLLVISHVINELTPDALEQLLATTERAQAVLWVEPGTSDVSRKLIAVRERLRGHFRIVAPCTHALECPMLAAGNERHWCHHFAKIPGYVHVDAGWGRFSATMQIDLSTLPFSFLVLDKRPAAVSAGPEESRVIGRARYYKGYAKALCCQSDGLRELTLAKRAAPELLKSMKKDPGSLYRWDRDGDNIMGGERIF